MFDMGLFYAFGLYIINSFKNIIPTKIYSIKEGKKGP